MGDWKLKTPVTFLIFNRPDTTARVFEEIRRARPPRLLVVADGPRKNRPDEEKKCATVRAIVEKVDWPCEVLKNYSDENLGCKKRVSSGLEWVFDTVAEAIILEDDCLPHPMFFRYCEELLTRYRDDQRVGFISGTSLFDLRTEGVTWDNEDYIFSRYLSVWGWASWRRVWKDYDPDIVSWPVHKEAITALTENSKMRTAHKHLFDQIHKGMIDTWDYQVSLMHWITGRMAIAPRFNLIENIGFHSEATHTRSSNDHMAGRSRMGSSQLTFPLISPRLMMRNRFYEKKLEALVTRSLLGGLYERLIGYVR